MYRVNVKCSNCGKEERITIQAGQMVEDRPCPTCKCKTLALSWMPHPEVVEEVKDA